MGQEATFKVLLSQVHKFPIRQVPQLNPDAAQIPPATLGSWTSLRTRVSNGEEQGGACTGAQHNAGEHSCDDGWEPPYSRQCMNTSKHEVQEY